ncbi:uncharacterized protein LOC115076834 isoform X5 [Rhinatrema bivittatum]|uniref:uncharacterized protein LOC115076834 isoform X5 n=1 Tax=Rhinatrema bivittatum TaxID=194408 RepID=UPI00112BD036|nr:uncharacterized protein LOC115076834 isoform X5 [Rhinatrema bivittatum]
MRPPPPPWILLWLSLLSPRAAADHPGKPEQPAHGPELVLSNGVEGGEIRLDAPMAWEKEIVWKKGQNKVAEWQQEGESIVYSDYQASIKLEQDGKRLLITDLKKEDEGEYFAEILMNSHYNITKYILQVFPRLSAPSVTCTEESNSIFLTCHSTSSAPVEYWWKRSNDEPITTGGIFELLSNGRVLRVSLQEKNPNILGCTVKNLATSNTTFINFKDCRKFPLWLTGLIISIIVLVVLAGVAGGVIYWKREALRDISCIPGGKKTTKEDAVKYREVARESGETDPTAPLLEQNDLLELPDQPKNSSAAHVTKTSSNHKVINNHGTNQTTAHVVTEPGVLTNDLTEPREDIAKEAIPLIEQNVSAKMPDQPKISITAHISDTSTDHKVNNTHGTNQTSTLPGVPTNDLTGSTGDIATEAIPLIEQNVSVKMPDQPKISITAHISDTSTDHKVNNNHGTNQTSTFPAVPTNDLTESSENIATEAIPLIEQNISVKMPDQTKISITAHISDTSTDHKVNNNHGTNQTSTLPGVPTNDLTGSSGNIATEAIPLIEQNASVKMPDQPKISITAHISDTSTDHKVNNNHGTNQTSTLPGVPTNDLTGSTGDIATEAIPLIEQNISVKMPDQTKISITAHISDTSTDHKVNNNHGTNQTSTLPGVPTNDLTGSSGNIATEEQNASVKMPDQPKISITAHISDTSTDHKVNNNHGTNQTSTLPGVPTNDLTGSTGDIATEAVPFIEQNTSVKMPDQPKISSTAHITDTSTDHKVNNNHGINQTTTLPGVPTNDLTGSTGDIATDGSWKTDSNIGAAEENVAENSPDEQEVLLGSDHGKGDNAVKQGPGQGLFGEERKPDEEKTNQAGKKTHSTPLKEVQTHQRGHRGS